jgi:uncharacterized protein (TIGR03382 family)
MGVFLAGTETPPKPSTREMDDPGASRTCHGDLIPGTNRVSGLSGEEHQDGEIWNGFYWEVYQGLKTAGFKACSGNCEAGPAIQYKTMQLAGGTPPTFATYWQTFKAAATALFPSQPQVASYVDCVAKRRKLDKCDRTVPVFAGESKVQFVALRVSPFQMTVPVTGAATFSVCSGQGRTTKGYVRKGQPVQITGVDQTGALQVTADATFDVPKACSVGTTSFDFPSVGTWYFLLEQPDGDGYRIDVGATGIAARALSTAPATCALPTLSTPPAGGGGGGTGGSPGGGGGCNSPGAAGLPALAVALAALLRRRARRG